MSTKMFHLFHSEWQIGSLAKSSKALLLPDSVIWQESEAAAVSSGPAHTRGEDGRKGAGEEARSLGGILEYCLPR